MSKIAHIITKLELVKKYIPGIFEIRESSGIHQFYKLEPDAKINPLQYIEQHYTDIKKGMAA